MVERWHQEPGTELSRDSAAFNPHMDTLGHIINPNGHFDDVSTGVRCTL